MSGETVSAGLDSTPLPNGAQFQTVFRATVDSPLTKGIATVYNQGTVSGSNFATIKTDDPAAAGTADITTTTVDRAPQVTGVFVRGNWSAGFISGLGNGSFGYAVPTGASQLTNIPWGGIDHISVRFSKNVSVAADDLTLFGGAGGTYALNAAGFSYDAATFTATWVVSGAPISNDDLRIVVDASATGVTQSGTGGGKLDGEWIDSTAAFPSGDGVAGTDFSFRLNVMAGDVNNDGVVNTTDSVIVRRGVTAPYQRSLDINTDGVVDNADVTADRALIGATAPAAAPAGTPGSGWVASSTATPPSVAGAAGTTITASLAASLVVDNDGDGKADPGDTIQYTLTVTNNSGAAATGLSFADTLDPHMTLVAGSLRSSPVLSDSTDTAALAYTENAPATLIAPNLLAADPDNTLSSATVSVSGWVNGQDVLAFTSQAGITGNYNSVAGTITFTGSATPAAYQTLLSSVTYQNSSENPSAAARTVSFKVNDGTSDSNVVSRGITVTPVNDPPVLAGIEVPTLAYNQNTGPITLTSTITASDVDNTTLGGATVTISTGYANGQDTLSVLGALPAGITPGAFNVGAGSITLTGSASPTAYQTALRQIQFQNVTGATTSKTISFKVNDGAADSNILTRSITINRAPAVTGESYNTIGNTPLLVGVAQGSTAAAVASGSVLSNDSDPEGNTPISINTNGAVSSGTVSVNNDGTFTYTPAVGFTGTATFTYTARDSLGAISQSATVTITVGAKVWYVDNSGSNGDGRATTPFNTLANALAASGTGDVIFVNTGSGNYTAGITLKANQSLIGRGVALSVDPDGAGALGSINLLSAGTAPTLVTSAAGTAGVTLNTTAGNANTIRGLNLGTTTGAGIFGSGFGTLNADTVAINAAGRTGQILDLTTGAVNATFTNLTTTSATNGVNLVNLTGTLTGSAGAISGVSGTDFSVGTGTASVSYAGSITNTAGNSVSVSGHTGGTIALSGAISDTGSGISLTNNSGATINFTGGLNLSTGAIPAFTATGGGTVTATQNNASIVNTITTTTATALNVANTTIGASGLTFRSISAGTAASGPAMGIDLSSTGSLGGLVVVGTGTAGTGGTIQKCTHGVFASNSNNISLSWMNVINNGLNQTAAGSSSTVGGDLINGNNLAAVANITLFTVSNVSLSSLSVTGSAQMGINGNAVNGLTITNSTINSNGNESFESGIVLQNASGTVSITGTSVRDNRAREMQIANGSGTMTLDTSNSQYGHASAGTGTAESQQGILLQLFGTSNTTINASTLTMSNNEGVGFTANALQINADNGGPVVNGSITSSTFDNNAAHVFVNAGGTSTVTFDTKNNPTMTRAALQAINYTVLGGSTAITANLSGTISGNTIVGGLPSANADGIDINSGSTWAGQMHIKIDGNTVQQVSGGIIATLDGNDSAGAATPRVDLRVTNNTVNTPVAAAAEEAIKLNTAVTSAHSKITVGWDVGGAGVQNQIAGHWANGASEASIFLRNRFSAASSIILPGYGGGAADDAAVQTYLAGRNTIAAPGGIGVTVLVTHSNTNPFTNGTVTTPLLAAPGGVAAAHPTLALALKQSDLNAIKSAAIQRWKNAGLTVKQLAALQAVSFQISDLTGQTLGLATGGNKVLIDTNAAGYGWYVDSTPLDDKEFATHTAATRLYAKPTAAPAGRIDLLTVMMHEMGHVLGLDDVYSAAGRNDLMYGSLTTGERRLPT